MAETGNPYQKLGEDELRKKYSEVQPDLELLKRRFVEIYSRILWTAPGNVLPEEYQKLQRDVNNYLDELIVIQECLGAAITTVNNQNREIAGIIGTK